MGKTGLIRWGILGTVAAVLCLSVPARAADPSPAAPLDDRQKAYYQKTTGLYAAHMFKTVCLRDYQAYITPQTATSFSPSANPELAQKLGKACSCMSNALLKGADPQDIMTYLRMVHGFTQGTPVLTPDRRKYMQTQGFARVGQIADNAAIRRQCGFVR